MPLKRLYLSPLEAARELTQAAKSFLVGLEAGGWRLEAGGWREEAQDSIWMDSIRSGIRKTKTPDFFEVRGSCHRLVSA
jgi:hypothetical protein